MTPLLGFVPDAEASTPGAITACDQFVPYLTGMEGAPRPVTPTDVPALAAACIGSAVVTKLNGDRRIFAGTAAKLYELLAGAWTDRTRSVGGDYTGGADTRWSFAQFGDATIASNKTDAMQASTTGAFADISGAPKAEIVFTVGAFVMALNYDDGTETADGWYCSAAFDHTDWVLDVTTQCTSGRLVSTPGALTAGLKLGEYAVAYKAKSIFLGQYVGSPVVWDWIPVAGGEAGCVGKDAICDIGGAHFFVGEDNFWLFDGTRPVPLGDNQVRQWFYDNSDPQFRYRTICTFDRQNNRVWVFFPGSGSETCNKALVFHVLAKKWGCADRDVEAAVNYIAPGTTFDTLDDEGATYDTLPDISYDSQYWLSGGRSLSIFNTSHQLQLMTGDATTGSFTTGDVGDDDEVLLLTQIRPRFAAGYGPTAATCETESKMWSGDDYVVGETSTLNDGKFDVLMSARWHRATLTMDGPVRVTHLKFSLTPNGTR